MQDMILFTRLLLGVVADFLMAPPIFYLFGTVVFLFVVKAVLMILGNFDGK